VAFFVGEKLGRRKSMWLAMVFIVSHGKQVLLIRLVN